MRIDYGTINNGLADTYEFIKKWVMVIIDYWTKESIGDMKT